MPVSVDDVRKAFDDQLKTLRCPHCNAPYTDFACAWYDAWSQGRRDMLRELNQQERDGRVKLKCEHCGGQAMTNAFLSPPRAIAME